MRITGMPRSAITQGIVEMAHPQDAKPSGLPLSTRDKQVEQNRTLFISVHQHELERVPLTDYQTIVDLIRNTKTWTGLSVRYQLDINKYDLGVRITDEQMLEIKLQGYKFHKDRNYTLQLSVHNM
jgi:hypothetical protein